MVSFSCRTTRSAGRTRAAPPTTIPRSRVTKVLCPAETWSMPIPRNVSATSCSGGTSKGPSAAWRTTRSYPYSFSLRSKTGWRATRISMVESIGRLRDGLKGFPWVGAERISRSQGIAKTCSAVHHPEHCPQLDRCRHDAEDQRSAKSLVYSLCHARPPGPACYGSGPLDHAPCIRLDGAARPCVVLGNYRPGSPIRRSGRRRRRGLAKRERGRRSHV